MLTISEVINVAMRKAGFSSVVNPPSQYMINAAHIDLNLLMAELEPQLPVVSAQFNSNGALSDPSGLENSWVNGVAYELAKRIQPDYATVLGPEFLTAAQEAMTNLKLSILEVPSLERRTDMPVGAGWKQDVTLNYYKTPRSC